MEKNDVISQAIAFAAKAHAGQMRKGTKIPYIFHTIEAAMYLVKEGCKDEVIAAAVLHDILEDTDIEAQIIEYMFGEEICNLVIGASENSDIPRGQDTWALRKQDTMNYLREAAPIEVLFIACADKLSNIKNIYEDYQLLKEEVWCRFNQGRNMQELYYKGLVKSMERLEGHKMYDEFRDYVGKVFGK